MKNFVYALCAVAGAFVGHAHARAVVIEEAAILRAPDPSWLYFGTFGVAIDGDWALVSAERYVDQDGGPRHEGTAFLYKFIVGTGWTYFGQLGSAFVIPPDIEPGLAMKNGVAVTIIGNGRVYERSGDTWTWVSYLDYDVRGWDIELSNGRALVPLHGCSFGFASLIAHPVAMSHWVAETVLQGNTGPCNAMGYGDLQNGRAALLSPAGFGGTANVKLWRLNAGGTWEQFSQINGGSVGNVLGPEVALSGPFVAITGRRERGTTIVYQPDQGPGAYAHTGLQAPDSYLEREVASATAIERVLPGQFAQRNYSFDRKQYVINVFNVTNNDPVFNSDHIATLQSSDGASVGQWLDTSGNRIISNGFHGPGGENLVRIYELPASYIQPQVQVENFDGPYAGAVWQTEAGSAFSVVRSGNTYVYRQSSTAGDASSWLPRSTATNQAIQAEVTLRNVVGADRWAGLLTRRSDASNYYYVTLRTSGVVQLKRKVNGAYVTLASAPATVVTGRKYRLRLESIGTAHRVYLDDRLVLTAYDDTLSEGDAGIRTYGASADYDNVIVTPSPLTSIMRDEFGTGFDTNLWHQVSGAWQVSGGVFHQTYGVQYARAYTGAPTADQIVQARIRPTSFAGPDYWVGLMARYQDDDNYLYVSLRDRDRITLRRRTGGVLTELASAPLTVTAGTWYDIRLEIAGELTRVYVNGALTLSSSVYPGPDAGIYDTAGVGQVGLITYFATADFDDFKSYQP